MRFNGVQIWFLFTDVSFTAKDVGSHCVLCDNSHWLLSTESDSHFVPDPEALRDTLREPLPPKHSVMPPKWLMSSTPEPGSEGAPRTPSNHPSAQYSSPSSAAAKAVRSVSSASSTIQQSSSSTPNSSSQATKQPPMPPPKPLNRNNVPMLGKLCLLFRQSVPVV